ncbi:MAG: hypothetical protein KDK36_19610, partial [Leptospiraceae bacterium]|nr:hypothetical protein [Leptospiraceae bacterium]
MRNISIFVGFSQFIQVLIISGLTYFVMDSSQSLDMNFKDFLHKSDEKISTLVELEKAAHSFDSDLASAFITKESTTPALIDEARSSKVRYEKALSNVEIAFSTDKTKKVKNQSDKAIVHWDPLLGKLQERRYEEAYLIYVNSVANENKKLRESISELLENELKINPDLNTSYGDLLYLPVLLSVIILFAFVFLTFAKMHKPIVLAMETFNE